MNWFLNGVLPSRSRFTTPPRHYRPRLPQKSPTPHAPETIATQPEVLQRTSRAEPHAALSTPKRLIDANTSSAQACDTRQVTTNEPPLVHCDPPDGCRNLLWRTPGPHKVKRKRGVEFWRNAVYCAHFNHAPDRSAANSSARFDFSRRKIHRLSSNHAASRSEASMSSDFSTCDN